MKKLLSIITLFLVLVGSAFAENHNKNMKKVLKYASKLLMIITLKLKSKK